MSLVEKKSVRISHLTDPTSGNIRISRMKQHPVWRPGVAVTYKDERFGTAMWYRSNREEGDG